MDLQRAADLAIALAGEAGDLAVAERATARIEAKGAGADLVTHVDREAERRIVAALRDTYPEHAILGEEAGEQGAEENEWRWLIDPLDGTHNYVLGLDVYGVCITLCQRERPVVAVVHDSPRRRTFWAVEGRGAFVADASAEAGARPSRLVIDGESELSRATVAFTQGYEVGHDDPRRNELFDRLERRTKRVLRSWAPSSDWALLVTGGLGALVAYRNEIWDLVGGALIATEAGAASWTSADGDLVVVGRPDVVTALRELVTR
ncbi:inositol monophosphatase family protein [Microbacterium arborescens]